MLSVSLLLGAWVIDSFISPSQPPLLNFGKKLDLPNHMKGFLKGGVYPGLKRERVRVKNKNIYVPNFSYM